MVDEEALETSFEPTSEDVICARGRTAYNHDGNRRFRGILEQNLQQYATATSKQEKSIVVSSILEQIQTQRPHAGFVRQSTKDGKWYKCAEHVCREKIGQGFRDLLYNRYRSSTKSKVHLRRERRRRERNEAAGTDDQDGLPGSLASLEPIPLVESIPEDAEELPFFDCPFSFSGQDEDDTKPGGHLVRTPPVDAATREKEVRPVPAVTPSSADRERSISKPSYAEVHDPREGTSPTYSYPPPPFDPRPYPPQAYPYSYSYAHHPYPSYCYRQYPTPEYRSARSPPRNVARVVPPPHYYDRDYRSSRWDHWYPHRETSVPRQPSPYSLPPPPPLPRWTDEPSAYRRWVDSPHYRHQWRR